MIVPAVIFDLDGTLIDNSDLLLEGFRYAYRKHNLPYPGDEKIFSKFGQPLKKFLLDLPPAIRESFRDDFRSVAHSYSDLKFHHGVESLLRDIRIPKAIVTGKERPGLEKVIETVGLERYFEVMVSSSDVERPKPSPDGILHALHRLGVEASLNSCYVGDTVIDMESALAAGLVGIGVGWSMAKEDLVKLAITESNIYFAESIDELRGLIARICGQPLSYS